MPGEKENLGMGVAYCPHCDGPFYKDKTVAVVGGGNSGIEASIDLAGIASTVKVFEFLPELKADEILVQGPGNYLMSLLRPTSLCSQSFQNPGRSLLSVI